MPRVPVRCRIGVALAAGCMIAGSAVAQQLPGPATCKPGYVWREATPDDRVCVPPRVRDMTAYDNRHGDARRDRRGGVPPGSCLRGYVWREAVAGDKVCVTPSVRAAAARDNQLAATRVAVRGAAPPPAAAPGTAGPPGVGRPAPDRRVVDTACDTYARRARKQFQLAAGMGGCATRPGPRWQDDYEAHYRWCMASPPRARRTEEQARDRWLEKCGAVVKID